jgi:hypothetical protein
MVASAVRREHSGQLVPDKRNRPSSAAKAVPKVIAATRTSVPQSFAQRLQWRRRVARELDHLLGLWPYPDPATLYAIPALREPEGEARP